MLNSTEEDCGRIGTAYSQRLQGVDLTRTIGENFFLGTSNPATCDGTVSELRYCFENRLNSIDITDNRALVAIYRPFTTELNSYIKVSEKITFSETLQEEEHGKVTCVSAAPESPVNVAVGDVLGACGHGSNDRTLQLIVMSEIPLSRDLCQDGALPESVSYSSQNDAILLSAMITSGMIVFN